MDFKIPTSLTSDGNVTVVTAYRANHDEPIYMADSHHPNFQRILDMLHAGDQSVWELFSVEKAVMGAFNQITDRVSWNGSEVLWDGDPLRSPLADHLARVINGGDVDNYVAVAKFWEKLESNPNAHSREQAYEFLAAHSFQITADGDVVGFKGVRENSDGTYSSTASSRVKDKPSAYVNGVPQPPLSRVTQRLGDTVSMPRSEVTHDPTKACERGLHVATRSYAQSYGLVLRVMFNPRDIVSVPTADAGEKVRVCRYVAESVASESDSNEAVLANTTGPVWAGDVGYRV